jgi:hypothetical protein
MHGKMKKYMIVIGVSALIITLLVSSGCSADVPVRYPDIELPPLEKGMSTSIVIDDIIEVPASELWHKTVEIPSTLEGGKFKLAGWCVASGGARNDIKVLILNDVDFHNWRNFGKVSGLYESEKITVDNFSVELKTPGKYHLVISNWFSEFSTKKVVAKVYLYWSVPPVEYKISADGIELGNKEIPAGANVTFILRDIDKGNSGNFTITGEKDKNEIPFTEKESGMNLWFIASPPDNYIFSCEKCTPTINYEFEVITAKPLIGQGFTVSSSMANAPPLMYKVYKKEYKIGEISVNDTILTVQAEDPDDDTLTYYGFNLPISVNGIDNNGRRIWGPAATLDEKTGVLKWNASSANLTAGRYTVRLEVTDGLLSDYQDVDIIIKEREDSK